MQLTPLHIDDVPTLETERLILKPLCLDYLSQIYVDWMNDPQVNKYLESGGDYTLTKLTNYLEEVERSPKYFWAITLKERNAHVGNIKIDPIHSIHLYGEYGIMIGDRKVWGKGIAEEASQRVINFCFIQLCLRKINLGVLAQNKNAVKLYEKLGFTLEGNFKRHIAFEGEYVDSLRMALFNPSLI